MRITYTNFTLLPIVAGVRFAQRLAGHQESTSRDDASRAKPVNAALSGLLAVEAAALKVVNMPLGSSLLALRKKAATESSLTTHLLDGQLNTPGSPAAPIGGAFLLAGDEGAVRGQDDAAVGGRRGRRRESRPRQ